MPISQPYNTGTGGALASSGSAILHDPDPNPGARPQLGGIFSMCRAPFSMAASRRRDPRGPYLCCGIVLGLLRQLRLPVELVAAHVQLDPVVAQHLLLAPHPHAAHSQYQVGTSSY